MNYLFYTATFLVLKCNGILQAEYSKQQTQFCHIYKKWIRPIRSSYFSYMAKHTYWYDSVKSLKQWQLNMARGYFVVNTLYKLFTYLLTIKLTN